MTFLNRSLFRAWSTGRGDRLFVVTRLLESVKGGYDTMADRDSAKHIPDWDGSSGSTEDEHDRNEKRAEAQRRLESTSPKVK